MTLQEIYNKVREHLLTQGCKSAAGGFCMYRGPDGTKCAVGCLITDEAYNLSCEGTAFADPTVMSMLVNSGIQLTKPVVALLSALRVCHDTLPVHKWEAELDRIADLHRLPMIFGPVRAM